MSLLNLLEEFIMFEKIRKMKNKKGFTLVELIVVLVILAILAALLIPALTGYIDKANQEKVTAECRMAVMAIQTQATSEYGSKGTVDTTGWLTVTDGKSVDSEIRKLAEVSGYWDAKVGADGKVTEVKYWNSAWTVTYKCADGTNAATYENPHKESIATKVDSYNKTTK